MSDEAGGGTPNSGPSGGAPPRPRHRTPLWLRLAEAIAALAGIGLLAIAALAIRLEWGPIEVDWLTPVLAGLLNSETDPLTATIDRTTLSWSAGHATVDLIAGNLRVVDPAGVQVVALPNAAISLSLRALLEGRLAPTRITLTTPQIRVVREATGAIGVAVASAGQPAEPAAEETPPTEPLPEILRVLAGRAQPDDTLRFLNEISIVRATANVDDREAGFQWGVSDGNLTLIRSASGFNAKFSGRLTVGAAQVNAAADLHFQQGAPGLSFFAQFDGLDLSKLADALPEAYRAVGAVGLPISGQAKGLVTIPSLRLGATTLELQGGAGSLTDSRFVGGHLDLRRAELGLSYDPAASRIGLTGFSVDLGGPTIAAKATLDTTDLDGLLRQDPGAAGTITGDAELTAVPLDRFAAIWPLGVAPNAREWIVANLSAGTLDSLKVHATAAYTPGAEQPVEITGSGGTMAIRGATIDYLDGLPKIDGVDATAEFNPQRMEFTVTAGRLMGLTVPKGSIAIDSFDQPLQHITIDLGLHGPATDVMTLLDVKRLQYAKAIGIDPAQVGGTVDGTLHFHFPLKKELPFAEVEYGAKAQLTDLSLPEVAFGRDLADGSFALTLDPKAVSLDGAGTLDKVPVTLTWTQRLSGGSGPKSEVHAKARLDDHARQRFGLDPLPDVVQGPADIEATYTVQDDHRATASIAADLTDTTLKLDFADWTKPAGVTGKAGFTLDMVDGHIVNLGNLSVDAGNLGLTGSIDFRDGSVTKAAFPRVKLGQTDGAGDVQHDGGPWLIKLHGPVIDLTGVLIALNSGAMTGDDANPGPTMNLDLIGNRMILGANRALRNADFHAEIARHTLASGTLSAGLGQTGKLSFRLDRVEDGGRFSLSADDFGEFFKVANIADNLVGGSFTLLGSSKLEGTARRFTGHAEGKDYRVIHMPFMARLLSLASFQSLGSLLTGEGIPFTTFKADLTLKQGRLDLQHGRAYGGAIGVNADGWFDLHAGTLSLEGTLVPAYMLNTVLGNLPVLGKLLVGGEGEGVFGANVRLGGSIDEPTISVNPLSALAPGFLRNLFLFDAPNPGGPPPDAPAPP